MALRMPGRAPLGLLAEGIIFADLEDETSPEFRARWTAELLVDWSGLQRGAPVFYDIVNVLAGARDAVGKDPKALAEYLARMKPHKGTGSPIQFDTAGDLCGEHRIFVH